MGAVGALSNHRLRFWELFSSKSTLDSLALNSSSMELPIFPVLFCLATVAGDELGGGGGVSLPCSVPGPRCDGDPGGRKKLMQPIMDRF